MCLIVVAYDAIEGYPLLIAANRDEEYSRPTTSAAFWSDHPDVLGGRDGLYGGTWLAVTRRGRFGAVTNLRGASKRPDSLSRGELVSRFVIGNQTPLAYARSIEIDRYAGFHLVVGEIGGDLVLVSGAVQQLGRGIHGLSNAPNGERWPKVDTAVEAMKTLRTTDDILRFLGPPMKHGDPTRDIFIAGDRYGTRSSTAIVADGKSVEFAEQNYVAPASGRPFRRLPAGPAHAGETPASRPAGCRRYSLAFPM